MRSDIGYLPIGIEYKCNRYLETGFYTETDVYGA